MLESLACGTPVIASDNGGTKEIIEDGVNGFLIQSGDYQTLVSKIFQLMTNNRLKEKFSKNGQKTIQNHFSSDKMINEFEKIINIHSNFTYLSSNF